MRIISGKYKKSNLLIPKKIHFRPTSDFVKESVFSSIKDWIENSIFLDLFAGSGNIGIEALSRGAKKVYFVDNNSKSLKIIRNNLKLLNISPECYSIFKKDFSDALQFFSKSNILFNVIYADPPYEKGFLEKLAVNFNKNNILSSEGIFLLERSKREKFNLNLINLELLKILEYGDKEVLIFINN